MIGALFFGLNTSGSASAYGYGPLALAGLLGIFSLLVFAGKPSGKCLHCRLPDPDRVYCPQCGRRPHRPANPFRLAIVVFGTIGAVLLAFLGCCFALWLCIAQNIDPQEKDIKVVRCLGIFALSFGCATGVRKVSR